MPKQFTAPLSRVPAKSILASRVFWLNALSFVGVVVAALATNADFAAQYPHAVAVLMALQSILNIVLRTKTSQAVKVMP